MNHISSHNIDDICVIADLLLGNVYANNRTEKGVIFVIKLSIKYKEYLFNSYQFFFIIGYCSNL
jgi:hypothetical protein